MKDGTLKRNCSRGQADDRAGDGAERRARRAVGTHPNPWHLARSGRGVKVHSGSKFESAKLVRPPVVLGSASWMSIPAEAFETGNGERKRQTKSASCARNQANNKKLSFVACVQELREICQRTRRLLLNLPGSRVSNGRVQLYNCSCPLAPIWVRPASSQHIQVWQIATCFTGHLVKGPAPRRQPRRTEMARRPVARAEPEPGIGLEAGAQTGKKGAPPGEIPKQNRTDMTGIKNLDTRITESGAYPSLQTASQAVRICAGPGPGMLPDRVSRAWPSCGTVHYHESSLGTQ